MKTKEELNALKEEVETLNEKLHELTEDELEQVAGGTDITLEKASVRLGETGVVLCPTDTRSFTPTISPTISTTIEPDATENPGISGGTLNPLPYTEPTSQSNRYFVYYEPDPIEKFSTNVSKQ